MQLQAKIAFLDKALSEILTDMSLRYINALNAFIGAEMDVQQTDASWKASNPKLDKANGTKAFNPANTTKKTGGRLSVQKGNLLNSFKYKNKNSVTDYKISSNKSDIVVGSKLPYAAIHEYGGFIKSKGRMNKFFWGMYYKYKNPYFKNLALSVQKRGGVNIPQRAYLSGATKNFESQAMPQLEQIFINKIASYFND